MPPRPNARCCRATLNQYYAPVKAIWVTDEVLSRAFQQYVHATGHKKRAVSSAPGPLYHRQRLGRRRMTELNSFQSAGSIPGWALPNAPDMTKWQWQPPRSPSFWPQMPQIEVEVETDSSSPLLPEPETEIQPLITPKPPESLALTETAMAKEQIMPRTLAETTAPLGLQLQALLNNTFPTVSDFNKSYRFFARSLKKEISAGRLRGPQIFEVYYLGRRALERARRQMPQPRLVSLSTLLSHVIKGIHSAEQLNPGFLRTSPHYWAVLLKHLARLDATSKTAHLFLLLMESMSPRCRFKTRGAVLNVLGNFFRIWQGSSIQGNLPEGLDPEVAKALHLAAMWAGRADVYLASARSELTLEHRKYARAHLEVAERCHEKASRFTSKAAHLLSDDRQIIDTLANALKTHDTTVHRSLFVIATRLAGSQGRWTRLRYNWLQILARLPNIQRSRFKSLLQLFPKRGYGALTHSELGNLLISHWESSGMLLTDRRSTRRFWKMIRGKHDTNVMAALAFTINATHDPKRCTAILWSFWDFVRLRVGVKTVVKQVLSLSRSQHLSVGFLKRLAWTSGDYRTALMLYSILVKQNEKDTNAWGPGFWRKYVTQNIRRPRMSLVNPAVLLEKVVRSSQPGEAVCRATVGEPQNQGNEPHLKHRQIARIRQSIKIIAYSAALTERQRFRHISAFTKYLVNVQGFLTARDLASLTNIVTEALKRGEGGSTERLRWYLGVVLEQLGEEACLNVGLILKRRRELNGRQLAGRVTSEEMAIEQQTASDLHRKHRKRPHQDRTWPLWRYHIYKNRREDKLRRARKKANTRVHELRLHDERPHQTSDCQLQRETEARPSFDGDALGALCERSQQQEVDPRNSFQHEME